MFPLKLLLTNIQVSKLRKTFENNFWANIELSKAKLQKIGQSVGFIGIFLGPLPKTGLPLIRNVLKLQSQRLLIPLELTAGVSAADAAIHKYKSNNL